MAACLAPPQAQPRRHGFADRLLRAGGVLHRGAAVRRPRRADAGRTRTHVTGTVQVGGKKTTSSRRRHADRADLARQFLLGADRNGRDIAVRLLYGGRNSLVVGFDGGDHHDACWRRSSASSPASSAASSTACSRACSTSSGPIPVVLLGIALGTALALGGVTDRACAAPGQLAAGARRDHRRRLHPVRRPSRSAARCSALREQEFVDAARVAGRWARCGSCRARSCRTSPRRSSSSCR